MYIVIIVLFLISILLSKKEEVREYFTLDTCDVDGGTKNIQNMHSQNNTGTKEISNELKEMNQKMDEINKTLEEYR